MKAAKILKIKKQIEASKKIMAKERDKLRNLIDDLKDIEYRFSEGVTSLGIVAEELDTTIEMFSEIV